MQNCGTVGFGGRVVELVETGVVEVTCLRGTASSPPNRAERKSDPPKSPRTCCNGRVGNFKRTSSYALHLGLEGVLVDSLLFIESLQFGLFVSGQITSVLPSNVDFVVLKRGL